MTAGSFNQRRTNEGKLWVFLGSASGPSDIPVWSITGEQSGAWLGFWGGHAGNVNGDGYGDIIAGADCYDNGEFDEGRAYVYHGPLTDTPAVDCSE